jgi:hypothetical protein
MSLCVECSFRKTVTNLTCNARLWWCSIAQLMGLPSGRSSNSPDHHRRHINTHALGPKKKAPTAAAASCHWRSRPGSTGYQTPHCASRAPR